MKKYLVGGAVRDMILGKEPHDKDYVVVGSTPEEIVSLGYKQVGKDFPVFLDEAGNEYALARTERKSGSKHTDFEFDFNPEITLEQYLFRRDFTVNSIAYNEETKEFVDPYNGMEDIKNKILRVTNPKAFKDDPLRVLRMARFHAQLDFSIEESTLQLAKEMIAEGCLKNLTSERIFNEIEKAASTVKFADFIHVLHEIDGLKDILPEIEKLYEVPENPKYHVEKNSGEHTERVINSLNEDNIRKNKPADIRLNLAALFHDVGKSVTPKEDYPHHKGHDILGIDLVKNISKRLKIPNEYRDFCIYTCKNHDRFRYANDMKLSKLYDFVRELTDRFKDVKKFNLLCTIIQADNNAKVIDSFIKNVEVLKNAEKIALVYFLMKDIHTEDFPELKSLSGEKLGKRYRELCIEKLRKEMEK